MQMSPSLWKENDMDETLRILDQWSINAHSHGLLTVAPRGRRVRMVDFCLLVNRMMCSLKPGSVRSIVFYFEEGQYSSAAWPIFVRLAEVLARRTQSQCRIVRTRSDSGWGKSASASRGSYVVEECERPAAWFQWSPEWGIA